MSFCTVHAVYVNNKVHLETQPTNTSRHEIFRRCSKQPTTRKNGNDKSSHVDFRGTGSYIHIALSLAQGIRTLIFRRRNWIPCRCIESSFGSAIALVTPHNRPARIAETNWTSLVEVRLNDRHGKSAGNIDIVLVAYDKRGKITDFGSLEIQAVYISGNLTGPFTAYLENPTPDFSWTQAFKYPKPDYLSSSRKRLIPQIIAKGSILKQWNKKQVVALQTSFYNTLPTLPEFDKAESDFAFFLYDLIPDNKTKILSLKLQRVVYTKFASALEQIAKFEAGSISQFTEMLQKKLDAKRAGASDIDNLENVVVE